MLESINKNYMSDLPAIENIIKRPRIDNLLEQAMRCNLVYVIAGVGCGKTKAVRNYVNQYPDAAVKWVQFTESDNNSPHFWEHFTRCISIDDPELSSSMLELGFPDTKERFKQFAATFKNAESHPARTFFVFDDFHYIHSKQILTFVDRCIKLQITGFKVIVIARSEPKLNTVSIFAKGKAAIITEEQLLFTDNEIAAFLKYQNIRLQNGNLPVLSSATRGWPIAVQLFSIVQKRMPESFDFAIETMKNNVFKLIEAEAFNELDESVQKIMIKLALLSNLPWAPLHVFARDASFLDDNPQLSSFIWFDGLIGDYRVHPLYMEFLKSRQDVLSEEEKLATYIQAAQWCIDNDFYMDAMYCFACSHQFARMIETLFNYQFKLPYDACEYLYNLLYELDPTEQDRSDHYLLFLRNFFMPMLLAGMGKYDEAKDLTFKIIKEWEDQDTPFALQLLGASYSNLAYMHMYICTVTHEYNSAAYLKKSIEYFKQSEMPPTMKPGPFSVPDIRSFACLVGEGAKPAAIEQFVEASNRTAHLIDGNFHDMYSGYDDLVACEIAYYKNQIELAKRYANLTIKKAREKNQYSIEMMAEQYLLRIALSEGDFPLAKNMLEHSRSHLENPHFWNCRLLYNLTTRFFNAQAGLTKESWLSVDEKDDEFETRMPSWELIVGVRELITLRKYSQALTVLSYSHPREPNERFLLGELYLVLLAAAAKIKTDDVGGAIEDFKRAYALSFEGTFEMPFVELGKNLHPLVSAALGAPECGIPEAWLKKLDRKAQIYAKKTTVIKESFQAAKKEKNTFKLSERELEILHDLYHGLIREEIAENRYLSLASVKKILESIRIKLHANNIADVIRIAIKNNLIVE